MGVFGGIVNGAGFEDNYAPCFFHRRHMWDMRVTTFNGAVPTASFGTTTAAYAIAAMGFVHRPMLVQGIGIPITTVFSSGNIKFNLGIYNAGSVTGAGGEPAIGPTSIVDDNAWGETTASSTVSGGQRIQTLSFQSTVLVPAGPICFAGAFQNNSAAGVVFQGITCVRSSGVTNGAAPGYKRYDNRSTVAPTYASTCIADAIVALTWQDDGLVETKAQNIDFALWLAE